MRIPDRHDDPLNAVRGIVISILLSIPLWALLIAAFVYGVNRTNEYRVERQETTMGSSFRTANGGLSR